MNTDVSKIKSQISCKDILNYKGIAASKGNIACPICGHGTATPCFGIFSDGNRFKCFSCNAGGDVVSLYQALFKCDFKQAVSDLKGRAKL